MNPLCGACIEFKNRQRSSSDDINSITESSSQTSASTTAVSTGTAAGSANGLELNIKRGRAAIAGAFAAVILA